MTERTNIPNENKKPDIQFIPPAPEVPVTPADLGQFKTEDFLVILRKLQSPAKYITSAPTDTPKSFVDSFRFYDTGGVRRLYVFINASWRYVTLT